MKPILQESIPIMDGELMPSSQIRCAQRLLRNKGQSLLLVQRFHSCTGLMNWLKIFISLKVHVLWKLVDTKDVREKYQRRNCMVWFQNRGFHGKATSSNQTVFLVQMGRERTHFNLRWLFFYCYSRITYFYFFIIYITHNILHFLPSSHYNN